MERCCSDRRGEFTQIGSDKLKINVQNGMLIFDKIKQLIILMHGSSEIAVYNRFTVAA